MYAELITFGLLAVLLGGRTGVAATDGTVTIRVSNATVSQIGERKDRIQEAISRYASEYCKKSSENCQTQDSHIRRDDVIILSAEADGKDVRVTLYIQDHQDPGRAALTSAQLASVVRIHAANISALVGKKVELIEAPPAGGMEGWRIAVIASAASVALLIVLIIIIVRCRLSKRIRERAKEVEREQRLSKYDDVAAHPDLADKLQRYESVKYDPPESPSRGSHTSATYTVTSLADENTNSKPLVNGSANGVRDKSHEGVAKRAKNGLHRTPSKRLSDLSSVNVEIDHVLSKTSTQSVLQRSVIHRDQLQSTISEEADIFLVDANGAPVTHNGATMNGGPHVTVITNGTANPVANSLTANGNLHISDEDLATPM